MTTANKLAIPTSQLLDEYKFCLEAMNRSPKTISWYLAILEKYFAFQTSNQMLKPVQELGAAELRAYILHLRQTTRWANSPYIRKATGKLSPYSIQGEVRAIKAFWGYLEKEGYIDKNPLARFPLPKVPQKPVHILSSEQIMTLLSQTDRHTATGAKYYTILLILLDSGLRISELVHIMMKDLDLQHNCVRVLGKGSKLRTVPISNLTRKEINRFIISFRPQLYQVESPYLFPRSDGTPISINSVQQLLRRLARKIGLDGMRCSPHIFRHTFATQSIANGANVFVLKEIMGHSSLTTTMKYTHLQPHDLQVQHAKFSPVANLRLRDNS